MSASEQRRFFDRRAQRYDRRFLRGVWPRNQEQKARTIVGSLGPRALAGTAVELGCGTGQIAELVLDAAPSLRYVGVDLSERMLDVARARLARFGPRAELRAVADARLPLDRGRADGAFGVDVLHHVEDPAAVLAELRHALRPGAPLVFLEGNPLFPITAALGILQREERGLLRIGLRSLRRWFTEAGLVDVDVRYGRLYTPPGPPRVAPLLDRLDRVAGAAPGLRSLAIYVHATGRVPPSESPWNEGSHLADRDL